MLPTNPTVAIEAVEPSGARKHMSLTMRKTCTTDALDAMTILMTAKALVSSKLCTCFHVFFLFLIDVVMGQSPDASDPTLAPTLPLDPTDALEPTQVLEKTQVIDNGSDMSDDLYDDSDDDKAARARKVKAPPPAKKKKATAPAKRASKRSRGAVIAPTVPLDDGGGAIEPTVPLGDAMEPTVPLDGAVEPTVPIDDGLEPTVPLDNDKDDDDLWGGVRFHELRKMCCVYFFAFSIDTRLLQTVYPFLR